jgi:2-keto-4-pentenoate hydratase/2-oxohepta-3-ene-1,7-dioic acid hydratase in catechol pathway
MKVLRYCLGEGEARVGFLSDGTVIDPLLAAPDLKPEQRAWFASTTAFIASGKPGIELAAGLLAKSRAEARLRLDEVTLAPPMIPSTILCAGSNYREHNAEKAGSPTSGKEPEFFIKTADCLIGPNDAIVHDPVLTGKLDCETELAIVIGKPGRHIPVAEALGHVFGYSVFNDVTARDRQVRTMDNGTVWYDLGRGKSFDTSAVLGPWIVTADEIGDPQSLDISTSINGELRQSSNTANMIWNCAELIHFFSVNFTLRPGMVISTGTPAGTAWSADKELGGKWTPRPGLVAATRYCEPGDRIESRIQGIGALTNRVTARPH